MADSGFEIEIGPDGKCDVIRDRRAFWYDADDLDDALQMIRRRYGRGIDVTVVEQDGYRTRRIT